eukprot:TRINITY_DN9496_c0_g1_i1.p1 TRINITY_DN9496_c0_g1~~TRINITY_DN9496_c0_g1_i1.p1  ORF type:complete len:554 (-),score=111.39 TRINITY_DN9496_c0_g1_i1:29-1639(-)
MFHRFHRPVKKLRCRNKSNLKSSFSHSSALHLRLNKNPWKRTQLTSERLVAPTSLRVYYSGQSYGDGPKPPLPTRIVHFVKEEATRLKLGAVQLGKNMWQSKGLVSKSLKGQTLSRRERMLLVRTAADVFRLVPFAVIVVVPFAEFSLPVLLKLFPNMLPSTFASKSQQEANLQRSVKAKIEVVKFLQETVEEVSKSVKFDTIVDKQEYEKFVSRVTKGEAVSKQELIQFGSTMKEEFAVDQLEAKQLKAMCKYFGLPPIGTNFLVQEALKIKLKKIYKDDEDLLREGLENLTTEELHEALVARGLKVNKDTPREELINKLKDWTELTRIPIPIYLHLLVLAHSDIPAKVIHEAKPEPSPSPSAVKESPPPQEPTPPVPQTKKQKESFESIRKRILPELIAIKNYKPPSLVENKVVDQLQNKINNMVNELETQLDATNISKPSDSVQQAAEKNDLSPEALSFISAVFDIFDRNDDKKIDFEELKFGIHELGINATDEEIRKIFDDAEKDNSGEIDINEFVHCVMTIRQRLQDADVK